MTTASTPLNVGSVSHSSNLQLQHFHVNKAARGKVNKQKPCVLWFTGLSGSGKTTLSNQLEQALFDRGHRTYALDGDNVRHGLNKDLGFTEHDRQENIRRVAEVAKLMVDAGLIVIATFISPFKADRDMARSIFDPGEFFEIYVDTPIATCEARDPKGLYKKAREGQIKNFTGIDSPYEVPLQPDLTINTHTLSVDQAVQQLLQLLQLHE